MDWLDQTNERLKTLKLPPHSAGHHIITRVPVALSGESVGQVKVRVVGEIGDLKSINYVYVLSKNHTLVGVFSFSELFTQSSERKISEIAHTPVTLSHPQVDQERVAHLALKHNIKSVPIVDDNNRFLGIIPSDHIHKILYQEYREAMLKSAGIFVDSNTSEDTVKLPVLTSFMHRVPWIIIGVVGGMLAAQIVSGFEETLAQNLILASFIPLIVYNSDAVGTQTQTLFVRDLTLNPKLPLIKYTIKQALITTLMALVCGLLVSGMVIFLWREYHLAWVIGASTTVAVISSTSTAIFVPYILALFKQDPANGSGPFATILQDMMSILIYFSVASALL